MSTPAAIQMSTMIVLLGPGGRCSGDWEGVSEFDGGTLAAVDRDSLATVVLGG